METSTQKHPKIQLINFMVLELKYVCDYLLNKLNFQYKYRLQILQLTIFFNFQICRKIESKSLSVSL